MTDITSQQLRILELSDTLNAVQERKRYICNFVNYMILCVFPVVIGITLIWTGAEYKSCTDTYNGCKCSEVQCIDIYNISHECSCCSACIGYAKMNVSIIMGIMFIVFSVFGFGIAYITNKSKICTM